MELDEVLHRVLRRYGGYLLLAVLLPVAVAWAVTARQSPSYLSTVRVQLTATTPQTATAADALVSQARAAVTSTGAVRRALDDAHAVRDPAAMIRDHIVVSGLGASSTIDLAVTDRDRAVAARVATSLAEQLVTSTNSARLGNLPDILSSIDSQLTQLASNRATFAAKAQENPKDAVAQNRLAGIDRLISDLSGDRNRLALEAAAGGRATIIDRAVPADRAEPSTAPQVVAVVGLAALVLGLLVVALLETLHPHVAGAARIGRMLGTQPLGAVRVDHDQVHVGPEVVARAGLAARRVACDGVVVVPLGRRPLDDALLPALAEHLTGRVPIAASGPAATDRSAGGGTGAGSGTGDLVLDLTGPPGPDATAPGTGATTRTPDDPPTLDLPTVTAGTPAGPDAPGVQDGDPGEDGGAEVPDGGRELVAVPAGAPAAADAGSATDRPAGADQALWAVWPEVLAGAAERNGVPRHSTGGLREPAPGHDPAADPAVDPAVDPAARPVVATAPVPGRSGVISTVRSLDSLDPREDLGLVAVLVAGPATVRREDVDRVLELLQLSGWPLLGQLTVTRASRWSRR
jgi:hypothetical protein